ncbi:MAG TPA: PhzF family phenazine biosynthesis protein [Nitrospiraceae bacterium]|nr:PhzF family phenazine biosynthesis protein [Nitrospiraceae bacterium]
MTVPIIHVDTFAENGCRGNAAAVCVLPGPAEPLWMQSIAYEMNVSETAFFYRGPDGFNLRWFSPLVEVDLCGHGTLAVAHVLRQQGYFTDQPTAHFSTRSGLLTAQLQGEWIELNFPIFSHQETAPPLELSQALGVPLKYVGTDGEDYLVELQSEDAVRSLRPDFNVLSTIQARAIIVTSVASSTEYDVVSRVFAPRLGIDEDPVTGSAHCCLGPFWMAKLRKKELIAYQASARGGVLRLRLNGERLNLSGKAVTVGSSTLQNFRPTP